MSDILRFAKELMNLSPKETNHLRNLDLRPNIVMRDDLEVSELNYEPRKEVFEKMHKEVMRHREKRLVEKFEQLGFSFELKNDLYEFVQTRCKIIISDGNLHELFVDDKLVDAWREYPHFQAHIKRDTFRMTAIKCIKPIIVPQ